MNLKSFDILNAADMDSVDVRLFRPIGSAMPNGVDGGMVAEDIAYLSSQYKKINIHINSIGGSVMDGWSILSAMMDSQAYITVYVKGLAASIAHVLSQAADRVVMADYSLMMMHDPHSKSGSGDPVMIEKFKTSLVDIYSKRSGMDAEKVSEMMAAQTWMNATEALEMGFADEIIETEARNQISNELDPLDLFEIVNQLEFKPKKIKMENVLNHLKLGEDSKELDVVKAIEAIENQVAEKDIEIAGLSTEVEAKNATIETLENKITEFETAETNRLAKEAGEVVDAAIKAKKVSPESREKWLGFAEKNLEGTKEILNSISANPKLSAITEDGEPKEKEFKGISIQNIMSEIDNK